MVDQLTAWPREREHVPFDAAAFNRLMNFLDGYLAAPFRLVQVSGSFALIWSPTTDLFTFGASVQLNATTTLGNTIWLDGFAADDVTPIHLIRVNGSDIIELGDGSQRMTIDASLTNDTGLKGRNAANSADIVLLKVTTSDIIELGAAGSRLSFLSPLTNNTNINGRNAANSANVSLIGLTSGDIVLIGQTGQRMTLASSLTNNTNLNGRNAANSADVTLIKLNTSDVIETGQTGTRHNLMGTVVAPSIDPPTVDGQVTNESQCKAFYAGYVSGGVLNDGYKYNIGTAVRNGPGDYTIPWARAFASQFYTVNVTTEGGATLIGRVNSKTASSADIHVETTAGVNTDPDAFHLVAFGQLS